MEPLRKEIIDRVGGLVLEIRAGFQMKNLRKAGRVLLPIVVMTAIRP